MEFSSDMLISEALKHPGAARVFEDHGLACAACIGAEMETISSVAAMHDIDVQELLDALNALPDAEARADA